MQDPQVKEILTRLTRIERMLRQLVASKTESVSKTKWVNATVITRLTGWDSEQMRRARRGGTIKWKREIGRIIKYDLNSLHPTMIKTKQE